MNAKLLAATLTLVGVALTVTTFAALSDSMSIPISGTINTVNVEAYSNSACTIPVSSLNMGTLSPGSSVTQTIYIKNSGTIPVTLTMSPGGWSPSVASSYLTLSWNRQNYDLASGSSVSATLTLTAASNTGSLTAFSCTATITGTE